MRHKVSGKKLNRDTKHRKALIKTQVKQLVEHGFLTTTEAKSKVIQQAAEKLLNKAKDASLHIQRQLAAELSDPIFVGKIIETATRIERPAGFIKAVRQGRRLGDNTMVVRLELLQKKEEIVKKDEGKEKAKVAKKESK